MRRNWPVLLLAVLAGGAAIAADAPPDLSGRDPHWIEDKAKHCFAANQDPEDGESISWSGACVDGLLDGPGTLTWYRQGKRSGRDEGTFRAGVLSGHGKILLEDGTQFEGEFPGHGTLTLPSGRQIPAQTMKDSVGWSIQEIHGDVI